jgi:glc operon protein GlcG
MRRMVLMLSLLVVGAVLPRAAGAQFIETRALSAEGAKQIMAAAEAEARRNNWNVSISIVDAAGGQIMFQKLDGAGGLTADIALGKARTAARMGRPTRMLQEALAAGNTAFLAIEGLMPLEGGIPIMVDGEVIGGIGVSGVTAPQDAQVAQAGLDVLPR